MIGEGCYHQRSVPVGRRTVRARGSGASGRVVEWDMLRNCVLICTLLNPISFVFKRTKGISKL